MITNTGRSGTAMILAGYGSIPTFCGIGSGSGVTTVSTTGLIYHVDRNAQTGSPDTSQLQIVTWTFDFSSTEMSGIGLKEFGLFNLASGGTLWHKEGFASINFDGSNELQISLQWLIF